MNYHLLFGAFAGTYDLPTMPRFRPSVIPRFKRKGGRTRIAR